MGQDRLEMGQQVGNREQVGQGPGLRAVKAGAASQDNLSLTVGECDLGAGELWCLCWDLGGAWPAPSKERFPFPAAGEEMGICVQPAGFQLYLPIYVPRCLGPGTAGAALVHRSRLRLQTFAFQRWS